MAERNIVAGLCALTVAISATSVHARELTPAEQLTAELVTKISDGTLSSNDVLNVTFNIRLPELPVERPGGNRVPDYLAVLKGCPATGVLQREPASYTNATAGQDVVEAVFDCSAREEKPMLVRFLAIFENETLKSVLVQKGLQVG